MSGYARAVESGRVVGIVALCAVAAVGAVVGGTVLLSRHESTTCAGCVTTPLPGTPAIELEVGASTPLGRAETLLNQKPPNAAAAAAIFRRYATPEAKLGLAFAEWTGPSSLAGVKALADANPDNPAILLNLGIADLQAGRNADAAAAWQETADRFPDSPYAVDALDALQGGTVAPGLPPIVVDPAAVPAPARHDLEAGVRAWDLKHVVTARRLLDAAAALAPDTPETLVAAAVARFSPASPKAPFPTLGPLSGTYPDASIVRLHLGVLLLWSREVARGKAQLRLATSEQPKSVYAKQARLLLQALGQK
jgi:tetratricopeptide (TPR) repeat protein